jgi:hypothetical protein
VPGNFSRYVWTRTGTTSLRPRLLDLVGQTFFVDRGRDFARVFLRCRPSYCEADANTIAVFMSLPLAHPVLHAALQLSLHLYYLAKPIIPPVMRFTLRHWYSMPLRWAHSQSWPIPASCTVPIGWPGWPGGKRFAFVLSHDVEGQTGLTRCRMLAALEMMLGFRSSFNFVPEGAYETPRELRAFLRQHGFEVGVHDLHHDGKLFRSRRTFMEAVPKINHYLKAWNASGFRTGFVRHNLEWFKQLDIRYDASTFDHDPFEPQPDGMNTIFPFWVRRGDGTGYVELPYTLVQDSTLFLVLRERTNAIWKQKLDWVAEQGGLAFVIVHPDYIAFDERATSTEYPVSHYRDFLSYARERYGNSAWYATPAQVADYVSQFVQQPAGRAVSARTEPEPAAKFVL